MEIGVYMGKSAILLGYLLDGGERLTVCDVFDAGDEVSGENVAESSVYYSDLQQRAFEDQYRRFHSRLPSVLAMPSTRLDREALAGTCRFVHVDGSHTYEVVQEDVQTARALLGPGGVVAFDDWAQPHTPGVGLAVWEEFLRGDLVPLAITNAKLYATWDRDGLRRADLEDWGRRQPLVTVSYPHELGDRAVCRFTMPEPVAPGPAEAVAEVAPAPAAPGVAEPAWRRVARQVAPPVALSLYRRARHRVETRDR